jgi:hypothetical protein
MLLQPPHAGCQKMKKPIKQTLLLAIAGLCLCEFMLHHQSGIFRGLESTFLSLQWMLLVYFAVWCGSLIFPTFSLNDLPLIGLLLVVIGAFFIGYAASLRTADAIILLAGVALGKGTSLLLKEEVRSKKDEVQNSSGIWNLEFGIRNFLLGLVVLLAFSSWWHLDMSDNFYHGPRWMGLWNNPNDYGLLMGAGVVLAIGLLAASPKSTVQSPQSGISEGGRRSEDGGGNLLRSLCSFAAKIGGDSWNSSLRIVLFIAAFMMGTGLILSYSRGAWVGTAIGLLYLAKVYGKFKWRWVLAPVLVVVAVAWFFWNTPQTAPWYSQRLDLSRGSVQHRVAAWKAGFEMMRDHPFGVGWNKAVETYEKNYSSPDDGAAAITTNDYLMLGTQVGIPALVCFVAYVALQLGVGRRKMGDGTEKFGIRNSEFGIKAACHAAVIATLVAFWFDGGLFPAYPVVTLDH